MKKTPLLLEEGQFVSETAEARYAEITDQAIPAKFITVSYQYLLNWKRTFSNLVKKKLVAHIISCTFISSLLVSAPLMLLAHVSEANAESAIKSQQQYNRKIPAVQPKQVQEDNEGHSSAIVAIMSLLSGDSGGNAFTFGSIGMPFWESVFPTGTVIGTSQVANWKYGKHSALTISYDDSAIGNALHGVPKMAEKGLVGTWFVNPGTAAFQKMASVWHQAVNVYNQEIANHTMDHMGGITETAALAAINDASECIKEHIYDMVVGTNKLLGFNKAGGTNWDIPTTGAAWEQRIRENYLIERKYSTGFYKAMPFEEMKMVVKAKSFATSWSSIHFHGICDDQNNGKNNPAYSPSYIETCTCTHIPPSCDPEPLVTEPDFQNKWLSWATCRFTSGYTKAVAVSDCRDGGTGAVKKTEIYKFYDYLTDADEVPAQKIWLAGYIAAKKYAIARDNSVIDLIEAGPTRIRLNLKIPSVSMLPPLNQVNLYDEPLTLFTKVPQDWAACKVTQNGLSHTYIIVNGESRFELSANTGVAVLENDTITNINISYVGYP